MMSYMKNRFGRKSMACSLVGLAVFVSGCFDDAAVLFLNPSFVNQQQGGLFPLVPGDDSNLLLARVVNATDQPISFLVTIERATGSTDDTGAGSVTEGDTIQLFTMPGNLSSEAGVLFDCSDAAPITRIGLGTNLNQPTTDAGLFIGGAADIVQGFGVPANINPLSSIFGDFRCGDTVIFQAIVSTNAPGGFRVQAFVLSQDGQPATQFAIHSVSRPTSSMISPPNNWGRSSSSGVTIAACTAKFRDIGREFLN